MRHVPDLLRWRSATFFIALALLSGCASELAQDPPPELRVRPIYDSETGVIPLPNVAAVTEDGTLPRRDGAGRGSAQGEFYRWFSELRGWPASTPITIPFDGALDPETVSSENIRLGRVVDGAWQELSASLSYGESECGPGCESSVVVMPDEPLSNGEDYGVLVSRSVLGAGGEPIGEPVAFFYAASEEPLIDADGRPTLALFDDDPETAETLEGLRRRTAPYLRAATGEVEREELALVFGWRTRSVPGVAFDADSGRLPAPNDLALDADGTFPRSALSFCGDEPAGTCAQGDFDSYLDGLHGWPTSTPISIPFIEVADAPTLDLDTVTDETVQLWKLSEDGAVKVPIEVGVEPSGIVIEPVEAIDAATRYLFIATRDVGFELDGETVPLLPDPITALAVQGNEVADFSPQVDACGEACGAGFACVEDTCEPVDTGCDDCQGLACVDGACVEQVCARSLVAEVSDCDAEQIEEARLALAPTVEFIAEELELDYDDLAALSVWTSVTDTFIDFDTVSGRLPFPNDLSIAGCPEERPICFLYDESASDPTGRLLNSLSERRGFSTFATNFVPTAGPPLDPATLQPATSVRFAQVPGEVPILLEASEFSVRYEAEHILVDFARPLDPETLSVGVVTTEALGSNGFPVQPAPAFALIRNAHPLVDENGASQVDSVPDATAQQLEPARAALQQLFDNAFIIGLSREQIAAAWPFTTGQTTRPTQELRARTHKLLDDEGGIAATDEASDVVVAPTTLEDPNFPGVQVSFDSVGAIHRTVEFETVDWAGVEGNAADTTRQAVGVTVYVPKDSDPQPGAGCEPPYDVAIVQHGLGGWRYQPSFALANDFASACIAVVAIDLPVHGGRTPGAASLHPATRPADSGDTFLTEDILQTLHFYQQSVIDLSIVTRLLRTGGFDAALGQIFSDADSQIGYVGVSLGGQVGTAYLAVEPDPAVGVINVAGANLALYLTESSAFEPLLDALGITPGTVDFIRTIHFLQWAADWVDPLTFASSVTDDPLDALTYDGTDYAAEPGRTKPVLVQMVDGDPVAPNVSTELLATNLGVALNATVFMDTEHAFLGFTDTGAPDIAQAECARSQAIAFISSAFDGDAALPPSLDAQTCVANF